MRGRHLFTILLALGLVAAPISTHAVTMGIQVEVLVDTGSGFVSQGFAAPSGAILDVDVIAGNTVRFIVGLVGTGTEAMTSYGTTVTADDPSEINYTVGSQLELTGLNFNSVANPNNTLNDGDPGLGQVNAGPGSVAPSTDKDFYRIDYVVQTPVTDASVDFSVFSNITSSAGADLSSGTANVRLNAGAIIPEPGTLLLLGTGLAALAGFGRRRLHR